MSKAMEKCVEKSQNGNWDRSGIEREVYTHVHMHTHIHTALCHFQVYKILSHTVKNDTQDSLTCEAHSPTNINTFGPLLRSGL